MNVCAQNVGDHRGNVNYCVRMFITRNEETPVRLTSLLVLCCFTYCANSAALFHMSRILLPFELVSPTV